MQHRALLAGAVFCLLPLALKGADYKLEPLKEPPPATLASPIREALHGEGVRVVDPKGNPLVDLWFRKEVPSSPPRKAQPGLKLEAIEEGCLIAAARYHQKHYDYKNKPFTPGIYTLRHGVQPMDGDHLGVSDTRDFAILCPAAADQALTPLPTAESVKLSCQVSGTKHPVVVWLKAPGEAKKDLPALVSEKDREYQIVEFRIGITGDKEKSVPMGLVVVGTAPEI